MKDVDKIFWPVLVILFIAVTFFVGHTLYDSFVDAQIKKQLSGDGTEVITITNDVFACENDNSVQSRGYIFLHGFRDHNPEGFGYQKGLVANDPKTKDILDYDYVDTLTLAEISEDFIIKFNDFIAKNDFEEIIILAKSAGGNIAIHSAPGFSFEGPVELHTLASPLNGYHVSERFVRDRSGFEKEMAMGFGPLGSLPQNIRVYHHKTIEDRSLALWCGAYADYCDPLKIQNNNVLGSKEFYYSGHNHSSIMKEVSKLIIECHK